MKRYYRIVMWLQDILKTLSFAVYLLLIKPKSVDEDLYRKELVCNILLAFTLTLTLTLDALTLRSWINIDPSHYKGIGPSVMLFLTLSILCLIFFSRKGYPAEVSQILIWILVTAGFYSQVTWGADLPSVILLWCFIITASSILISTRYSFFLGIIISIGVILFQTLEEQLLIAPLSGWKDTPFRLDDALEYSFVFMLISGVSWVSNREIFKSLLKVRDSKLELQNERDSLEVKVARRTQELQLAQIDKINSMYQLVEFGRISSGLFHDLITPLNTLSIAVNSITNHTVSDTNVRDKDTHQIREQIEMCIRTSNKISEFINLAKRQIQHIEETALFNLTQEIYNSVSLLQSKARHRNVNLKFTQQKKIYSHGSPTLFSHIITNLISNAIDSYEEPRKTSDGTPNRDVLIYIQKSSKNIEIKIKDFGCGIPNEIQANIFDPFFTTKSIHGCGIGLSATKHTLEKYFGGQISFISNISLRPGTTFIVNIPFKK